MLILSIWGSQAGPHMQALHFSFAAGAFISPIIAKLLFGKYQGSSTLPGGGDNITAELSSSAASSASSATIITDKVAETLDSMRGEGFHSLYAYFVIGALLLLISLAFVILYSCGTPTQPDRSHPSPSGELLAARHHTALVCLLAVFFFWYVGAEVTYGSFIFTYAKEYAGMAQAQAAGLNALFWGTFAATRGLAIFFAACMRPGTMILLSLVGCTFSSLLLVLFSRSGPALWSCTALHGHRLPQRPLLAGAVHAGDGPLGRRVCGGGGPGGDGAARRAGLSPGQAQPAEVRTPSICTTAFSIVDH